MTSGGIPVNHCQDVLNKQRTVVLRVHEKSIKALKCDRGGTDASSLSKSAGRTSAGIQGG